MGRGNVQGWRESEGELSVPKENYFERLKKTTALGVTNWPRDERQGVAPKIAKVLGWF